MPVIQGYEDAGDFTVRERLKTSAQVNLIYYLCVGVVALCGLILLVIMHKDWLAFYFFLLQIYYCLFCLFVR